MGGKSGGAPSAPDPQQTAAAQQTANIGTARVNARLNRVDQNNPWYSISYSDMGDRSRDVNGNPVSGAAPAPAQGATPGASGTPGTSGGGPDPNSRGGDVWGPSVRTMGGGDGYTGPINWDDQGNPSIPSGSSPAVGSGSNAQRSTTDPNDPLAGEQAYWNQDRWKQTVTLNPVEQQILDQQRGLSLQGGGMLGTQLGRVNEALGKGLDFSQLPSMVSALNGNQLQNVDLAGIQGTVSGAGQGIPTAGQGMQSTVSGAGQGLQNSVSGAGQGVQSGYRPTDAWSFDNTGQVQTNLSDADYGQQRQSVEDALYNRATSRLDPAFAQRDRQERQMLADKGLVEGSEAYNAELDRLSRDRNDAYAQARNDAITGAGNEQSRLFGMDLSRFNAENAAQGQQFGQTAQQRAQRYAEEQGLAQFGNQAQNQQFSQNLANAQFGNQAQAQAFGQGLDAANFQNAAQNQQFGQGLAAQGQGFNQNLQAGQFQNAAQGQRVGQQMGLRGQQATEQQITAQLAQLARQQGIDEQQLLRNLPINDLVRLVGALNGGGG